MRCPPTLALVATITFWSGLALPAAAQNGFGNNNQSAPAANGNESDSVTFVIKLDEKWLQALRNGQPLKSTIPPELRGRVTEVRIELDDTVSAPAGNTGFGGTATSGGTRLGPWLPAGFTPQQMADNRYTPGSGQTGSLPGSGGYNPNTATNPAFSAETGNSNNNSLNNWNNTSPSAASFGNSSNGTSNGTSVPRFTPPNTGNGMTPVAPRTENGGNWNPPSSANPATTGNQWNGASRQQPAATGGFVPPLRQPTGDSGQAGNNVNEFDTSSRNMPPQSGPANALPALDANRFADSRYNGYRPQANPYSGSGSANAQAGWNQPANPYQQRNGSLIAGYQLPAVPGLAPDDPANRSARLPVASIPGSNLDNGERAGTRRPGSEPVATKESTVTRFNGFLYFMLLCSIGLNFYLGLISRGFYVRYRELADELRETFATV